MDVLRLGLGAGIFSIVACGASHVASLPQAAPAPADAGTTAAHIDPVPAVSADAGAIAIAPEIPMEWGTPGAGAGPLYAIADGMCVNAQVFPVEGGAIFTYGNGEYVNYEISYPTLITTAFVGDAGITPDPGRGFGAALDAQAGTLSSIGGSYPDHLFARLDFASRAFFALELRVGTARPTGWKAILGTNPYDRSGRIELPSSGVFVAVAAPIGWTDGGYLFATDTAGYNTGMAEPHHEAYAFRVLQADGTLAAKANVPGPDLAETAFLYSEPRATARLASGEVVGISGSRAQKLVRWSPIKPVDDVPFPFKPKTDVYFRGGKSRAVVALDDALYIYDGGALVPSKLNPKLVKGFAWTIGPDDEIVAIQPSGALLEESISGVIHEETLPFAAKFDNVRAGIPWGVASGKGNRGSDAIVRKKTASGAKRWEVVELPAPPFGSDARAPLNVTSIAAKDATDVFVIAQRSEPGYGWKHPPSFRALYRTKRPREVVRCQDAPHAWTGTGTHRWPPAADAGCKTPVVVASFGDATAKGYPNMIAASLRGKTQLGETLPFVTFAGRGTTNLGILMTDMAKAKALATQLSVLGLRPEVSCGKPAAVRSFTLDVAKATFSN